MGWIRTKPTASRVGRPVIRAAADSIVFVRSTIYSTATHTQYAVTVELFNLPLVLVYCRSTVLVGTNPSELVTKCHRDPSTPLHAMD